MTDYKVPGIWKWTVILLIACNMGLVLTLWLKPQQAQQQHGNNEHGQHGPRNYIIEQLKLSREQVDKYDGMIKEHRRAMDSLRAAAMDLRTALFNNIKSDRGGLNPDSLAHLVALNQEQVEIVTYRHFARVRKEVCNDAQKKELDRIIQEVMKKMNGNMRGERPDPEHRQGPPPPDGLDEGNRGPDDGHRPPPPDDH